MKKDFLALLATASLVGSTALPVSAKPMERTDAPVDFFTATASWLENVGETLLGVGPASDDADAVSGQENGAVVADQQEKEQKADAENQQSADSALSPQQGAQAGDSSQLPNDSGAHAKDQVDGDSNADQDDAEEKVTSGDPQGSEDQSAQKDGEPNNALQGEEGKATVDSPQESTGQVGQSPQTGVVDDQVQQDAATGDPAVGVPGAQDDSGKQAEGTPGQDTAVGGPEAGKGAEDAQEDASGEKAVGSEQEATSPSPQVDQKVTNGDAGQSAGDPGQDGKVADGGQVPDSGQQAQDVPEKAQDSEQTRDGEGSESKGDDPEAKDKEKEAGAQGPSADEGVNQQQGDSQSTEQAPKSPEGDSSQGQENNTGDQDKTQSPTDSEEQVQDPGSGKQPAEEEAGQKDESAAGDPKNEQDADGGVSAPPSEKKEEEQAQGDDRADAPPAPKEQENEGEERQGAGGEQDQEAAQPPAQIPNQGLVGAPAPAPALPPVPAPVVPEPKPEPTPEPTPTPEPEPKPEPTPAPAPELVDGLMAQPAPAPGEIAPGVQEKPAAGFASAIAPANPAMPFFERFRAPAKVEQVARVAGSNRVDTAVKMFEAAPKKDVAVLSTGRSFADGLSGGSLAGALKTGIMLTNASGNAPLEDAILEQLKEHGTKQVYVTGGFSAVGEGAEASLKVAGITVTRLAGENRFETAKKIGAEIDKILGKPGPVFVASGSNFPDALVASSAAARTGGKVVLVDEAHEFAGNGVCVGGPACSNAPKAAKVIGQDRYETAYQLAARLPFEGKVVAVSGKNFPDALAAGAWSAATGSTMVLTDGKVVGVPKGTNTLTVAGGGSVIAEDAKVMD